MTLTETLLVEEKYLKFEDMRAFDYCERRWKEAGYPTERWQMINFLEKMLRELLKDHGGYPKVLLLRKKEIQRQQFTIRRPEVGMYTTVDKAETEPECSCSDGWLLGGKGG